MSRVVGRGACKFCSKPVIWGRLQNGQYRTFHPELMPAIEVPEVERYAVRRRYNAVVNLDGEKSFPAEVLVPHYCNGYRDERLMRGMESLHDMIDEVVPNE